jgi:hypothetical protein
MGQFDGHVDAGRTLGLKLIFSEALDEALDEVAEEQTRLECEQDGGGFDCPEADNGDAVILVAHDADRTGAIIDVLGVCLKHPGQKTWVIANSNEFESVHLFAVDSLAQARKRVADALVCLKKMPTPKK